MGTRPAGALLPSSGSPLDALRQRRRPVGPDQCGDESHRDTPLWATGKPAYESFREVARRFQSAICLFDDELTSPFPVGKRPVAGPGRTGDAHGWSDRTSALSSRTLYAQQLGAELRAGGNLRRSATRPRRRRPPTSWGFHLVAAAAVGRRPGGMANGVGGLAAGAGPSPPQPPGRLPTAFVPPVHGWRPPDDTDLASEGGGLTSITP